MTNRFEYRIFLAIISACAVAALLAVVSLHVAQANSGTSQPVHSVAGSLTKPRTPTMTCSQCGAPHGGVHNPQFCHNCVDKGFAPKIPFSHRIKHPISIQTLLTH